MITTIPKQLALVNNLQTSSSGKVLDAYQGKVLYDSIFKNAISNEYFKSLDGKMVLVSDIKNIFTVHHTFNKGLKFNSNDAYINFGTAAELNDDKTNSTRGIMARIDFHNREINGDWENPIISFTQYRGNTTPNAYTNSSLKHDIFYLPTATTTSNSDTTCYLLHDSQDQMTRLVSLTTFAKYGHTFYAQKMGLWCMLFMTGASNRSGGIAANTTFGTLPAACRPRTWIRIPVQSNSDNTFDSFTINANGAVVNNNSYGNTVYQYFCIMYITQNA